MEEYKPLSQEGDDNDESASDSGLRKVPWVAFSRWLWFAGGVFVTLNTVLLVGLTLAVVKRPQTSRGLIPDCNDLIHGNIDRKYHLRESSPSCPSRVSPSL